MAGKTCACPTDDGHRCVAMRYGKSVLDVDEPCECACHDDDEDFDECPTCHGKGTVNPLTAPDDFFCAGVADCPHCDGTGRF